MIQSLLDKGIIVYVLNMGMMDNTPTGKLVRNVMLAFAEFERDMIVERTEEGKVIARQNPGFKEGRPPKYGRAQLNYAIELAKYPGAVDIWVRNWQHVVQLYNYGSAVRKVMYTTNAIEYVNSGLRKVTKKGAFPNEECGNQGLLLENCRTI